MTNCRILYLDGIRALSVIAVIGFHLYPSVFGFGFVGVDVFFVLSGFLIGLNLLDDAGNSFKESLKRFYVGRIRRILPALLIVVFISTIVAYFVLLPAEYVAFGKYIISVALFTTNIHVSHVSEYYAQTSYSLPLLNLWSLSVEEQFYLFWPILILSLNKFKPSVKISVIAVICISSYIYTLYLADINMAIAFFSTGARLFELSAGTMIAVYYRRSLVANSCNSPLQNNTLKKITEIGFLLILIIAVTRLDVHNYPGYNIFIPLLLSFFFIIRTPKLRFLHSLLSNKYLVLLGLISYPLYLVHWPIISFHHLLFAEQTTLTDKFFILGISIGMSLIIYYFVELRLRKVQSKFLVPILLIALIIQALFGAYIIYKNGMPTRQVALDNGNGVDISVPIPKYSGRCENANQFGKIDSLCTKYVYGNGETKLVLWGDSTVDSWESIFRKIASSGNYTIYTIIHRSCPPLLNVRKTHFSYPESIRYCSDGKVQSSAIEYFRTISPNLVVVAAAWNAYNINSPREFITDDSIANADAASTKSALDNNFSKTIKTLAEFTNVLIFRPWPYLQREPAIGRSVGFLNFEFGLPASDILTPRDSFNAERIYFDLLIDKLVAENNISDFDPSISICGPDFCHSVYRGVPLYSDSYHLSPYAPFVFYNEIELLIKNYKRDSSKI